MVLCLISYDSVLVGHLGFYDGTYISEHCKKGDGDGYGWVTTTWGVYWNNFWLLESWLNWWCNELKDVDIQS